MSASSILVVDDNWHVCDLIGSALSRLGHTVTLARDGFEAFDAVAEGKFDLVITDVVMPGRDGFEVMGEVRRTQPQAAIIVISGSGRASRENYLRSAKGLGADAVLGKPFTIEDLVAAVDSVLVAH